ncbi:MAG TPA: hypothetical protein VGM07_10440 [Stellaceae bacterium]|jgi:hypothetical protein
MKKGICLLSAIGFFGLLASGHAQTPPAATAAGQFDGTYAFVSAAKANQTYTTRGGRLFQCPELSAGPLTIAQGRASYTTATGHQLTGTVGPQGQLAMGSMAAPSSGGGYRPVETNVSGRIEASGYARARQIGNSCSYDFLWQKEAR